jgi:hypothetical protein
MARPIYKIGFHNFLTIQGEPILPREMLEIDQRHGVPGTEFTQLADKGVPFFLVTQRDYLSINHAKTVIRGYRTLITSNPVEIIINDHSSIVDGYKVQVLAVEAMSTIKIKTPVGGLEVHVGGVVHPAFAWVRWDLISVSV